MADTQANLCRMTRPNYRPTLGRFSIAQLAELIDVRPAQIKEWVRKKLLLPVSEQGPAVFDFTQVSAAKHLRKTFTAESHNERDEPSTLSFTAHLPHRKPNADLLDLALRYEEAGELAAAAEVYRTAIDREPEDATLHFNLGNVLWGLRDFTSAEVHYQTAVKLNPHSAEAWNNLGLVRLHLGLLSSAVAALQRALQLAPEYAAAKRNLADCLRRQADAQPTAKPVKAAARS